MINKQLHWGDNLPILKKIFDESVDLIYLDPSFNSNRNYNMGISAKHGKTVDSELQVFEDSRQNPNSGLVIK